RGDTEIARKSRDRFHNGQSVTAARQICYKRFVDLNSVKREISKVAQRRIPGAEIVERDTDAEATQLMEGCQRCVVILKQNRFSHFQFQMTRRKTGRFQRADDPLSQVWARKLK